MEGLDWLLPYEKHTQTKEFLFHHPIATPSINTIIITRIRPSSLPERRTRWSTVHAIELITFYSSTHQSIITSCPIITWILFLPVILSKVTFIILWVLSTYEKVESSLHKDDRITSTVNTFHHHYYSLVEQQKNLALVHYGLYPMYQIPSYYGIPKN